MSVRIGQGYDVHAFGEGKRLSSEQFVDFLADWSKQ